MRRANRFEIILELVLNVFCKVVLYLSTWSRWDGNHDSLLPIPHVPTPGIDLKDKNADS